MATINWQEAIRDFADVSATHEEDGVQIICTWEYIGEGYEMDYVEDDPEDVPLLRFYLSRFVIGDEESLESVDDGSYCTEMPINTPKEFLLKAAEHILATVAHNIIVGSSYKHDVERLSWINPSSPI